MALTLQVVSLVYSKLNKSQIPGIERAMETAARMLGSDKSHGYCLEMICADFLACANLDNDPELLLVRRRLFRFLSPAWQHCFFAGCQTTELGQPAGMCAFASTAKVTIACDTR